VSREGRYRFKEPLLGNTASAQKLGNVRVNETTSDSSRASAGVLCRLIGKWSIPLMSLSETLIPRNRMLETGSYGSVGELGVTHLMSSSTRNQDNHNLYLCSESWRPRCSKSYRLPLNDERRGVLCGNHIRRLKRRTIGLSH
jgi:hypothetical protein